MSYSESIATCNWCERSLHDDDDVACRDCYEKLESELAESSDAISKARIVLQDLRDRIAVLEQERDMANAADAGTD